MIYDICRERCVFVRMYICISFCTSECLYVLACMHIQCIYASTCLEIKINMNLRILQSFMYYYTFS